jgi:hypothetical protein
MCFYFLIITSTELDKRTDFEGMGAGSGNENPSWGMRDRLCEGMRVSLLGWSGQDSNKRLRPPPPMEILFFQPSICVF